MENLAIQIMEEHENQAYRRLYEIQKEMKSEEKEKKEKIIKKFINFEEKYYEEVQKKEKLDPNQISQEIQKISLLTKLCHQKSENISFQEFDYPKISD
jgi:alcohol dehydrogenase YqhD (iron-dependent ADH family)